ncbi:MAG TPA: ATP-binding protein [Patescibacteria group bacterium]|nr:ATP-binding protein [Patescibacteria group bacterium]
MKISQKLVLLFLFNGLIPTLAIGGFSYFNTQRSLDQQIQIQLRNTLARQSDKIDIVATQNIDTITLFALREQMRLILDHYDQTHQAADRQQLNAVLTTFQHDNRSLRRIHILDTNGAVISSSDPRLIGKSYAGTPVFAKGSAGIDVTLFFKDIDGVLGQYLTAPVFQNGHKIGVAIIENQVDSYLQVTSDYTDTGKTGETFLVGPASSGRPTQYLTPVRFNADAALTVYHATSQGAPKDYRNHPVLQLTKTIDSTGWTVGVKMDKAEVYAPVFQLRNLTIITIVVIAIAMALLGWFFPRRLSRRLTRFTAIATRIRDGSLGERVQVDSKDEIGTLATAFNDMTTGLLESHARLIASILGLSQGFIMANTDGTVITINDAARRLLKAPSAGSGPETMSALFHNVEQFDIAKYIKDCLEQKKPAEARDVTLEGAFFNIFLSPIMLDGQTRGVVVLLSDETEERILQRSRDEFFSIASHELRTPLTAIRGNTNMMLDYYKEQLKDPDLHSIVNDVYEASVRLIDIVNDFLDMSSLEQGKIAFVNAPFDIVATAKEAIIATEKAAADKKLTLRIAPPKEPLLPVVADHDRVRQILASMLDNAVKFTETGTITISFEPTAKATMRIHVTDPGRGIPPEAQKLLFHKFQQATGSILTRDNTSATGLGLYIGRLLAQGLHGTLDMTHTEVGKGTTFTLELPMGEATASVQSFIKVES